MSVEQVEPTVVESTDGVFSLNLAGGDDELVAWSFRFEVKFGPEFDLTDEFAVYFGQQVQQMMSGFLPFGSENSEAILRAIVVHVRGLAEAA
jgi:hypothetical protein